MARPNVAIAPARQDRPLGVALLAAFFAFGVAATSLSSFSLLWPGSPLEPIWRLNPRGHEGFRAMGPWAVVLLLAVGTACGGAAVGLWRGARWGSRLAIALLTVNAASDLINAVHDPRTLIGLPIAAAMIVYLRGGRARRYFSQST